MPGLKLPSEVFVKGFQLPKVASEDSLISDMKQHQSLAYGIPFSEFGLLLPINVQSILIDNYNLCMLPTASDVIAGVIFFKGNTVPIFELNKILDIVCDESEQTKAPILVIGEATKAVGFKAKQVPLQVDLDAAVKTEIIPPLPSALKSAIGNCYRLERYWIEWDYEKFFLNVGHAA